MTQSLKSKRILLDLNSQPTDHQPGIIIITLKNQVGVGDTEKLPVALNHA